MGSFLSGIVSGGVDEAEKRTKSGKPGLMDKIRKAKGWKAEAIPNAKPSDSQAPKEKDDYAGGFKRGGKIKGRKGKAVMIKAHAGERVLTEKQQRRMKRRMGGKRGAGRRR